MCAFGFGAFGRALDPSKWSDMKRSGGEDRAENEAEGLRQAVDDFNSKYMNYMYWIVSWLQFMNVFRSLSINVHQKARDSLIFKHWFYEKITTSPSWLTFTSIWELLKWPFFLQKILCFLSKLENRFCKTKLSLLMHEKEGFFSRKTRQGLNRCLLHTVVSYV